MNKFLLVGSLLTFLILNINAVSDSNPEGIYSSQICDLSKMYLSEYLKGNNGDILNCIHATEGFTYLDDNTKIIASNFRVKDYESSMWMQDPSHHFTRFYGNACYKSDKEQLITARLDIGTDYEGIIEILYGKVHNYIPPSEKNAIVIYLTTGCSLTDNREKYIDHFRSYADQIADTYCADNLMSSALFIQETKRRNVISRGALSLFTLGLVFNLDFVGTIYTCGEPIPELLAKRNLYFNEKIEKFNNKQLAEKKLMEVEERKIVEINQEKELSVKEEKRNSLIKECELIGFSKGTDGMGNCVLKLMELEPPAKTNVKSISNQPSSSEYINIEQQKINEYRKQTEAAKAQATAAKRQADALEEKNRAESYDRSMDSIQKGLDILNCTTWPNC